MSRLQLFAESDPLTVVADTVDHEEIRARLAPIGVTFERWPTRDIRGDVLATYAPEIDHLKVLGGYRSIDVVRVTPDHPERESMRARFLSEHTHAEQEVRFFVEGEALFTLHADGHVWNLLCCQGDLISIPAGMRHWFDMGTDPCFTAVRMFVNPDGWVAAFTGDTIADRFPRYQ